MREGVDRGAELLAGSESVSENCYVPTVLYDPPGDARVSTSEILGPVICVYQHADIDEAIARSNSLPYAFQASVSTNDLDTALRASRRLDASAVMVNDHPRLSAWIGCRSRDPVHDGRHADQKAGGHSFKRSCSSAALCHRHRPLHSNR